MHKNFVRIETTGTKSDHITAVQNMIIQLEKQGYHVIDIVEGLISPRWWEFGVGLHISLLDYKVTC